MVRTTFLTPQLRRPHDPKTSRIGISRFPESHFLDAIFRLAGPPSPPCPTPTLVAWNRSSPDCLSQENDSDGGVTLVTSPSVFIGGSLSHWHRDLTPDLCGRFRPSPVDLQSITCQRNVGKDPTHRVTIKRTLVIMHRVDMNEDQLANASSSSHLCHGRCAAVTGQLGELFLTVGKIALVDQHVDLSLIHI